MAIPEPKLKILETIVDDMKRIDNIAAIVLGGSHCIGMANEKSDLEIYYHENFPFDIDQIKAVARKYNSDEAFTVTNFYQNGGPG